MTNTTTNIHYGPKHGHISVLSWRGRKKTLLGKCLQVHHQSTTKVEECNGSSDSTQLYTDVIRISMILRCTLVQ